MVMYLSASIPKTIEEIAKEIVNNKELYKQRDEQLYDHYLQLKEKFEIKE